MNTHVIVQYTIPVRDFQDYLFLKKCYFEGDEKSADWDGRTLTIGRRVIHSNDYFVIDTLTYDDDIDEFWACACEQEDKVRLCELEEDRREADMTDIQYLKIGDTVLRDIRDEKKSEEDSDA